MFHVKQALGVTGRAEELEAYPVFIGGKPDPGVLGVTRHHVSIRPAR